MTDTVLPPPAAPLRPISRLVWLVRRWIPRSLVLAVLGIGLSSWLIPAFTRQWDDRQEAGELKATIVAQMATATGRALLDAQAFYYAPASTRPSAGANGAVTEWSVAALEIRARLDAYFGSAAVARWDVVSGVVRNTLSHAYGGEYVPGPRPASTPAMPERLQKLYSSFYVDNAGIDDLVTELLAQEEIVARSILAMPVRGYSTTWRDILRDLVPNA